MGQVVPLRINVDKQPNLAQFYGVQAPPVVLALDATGKPLGGIRGFYPPKEFVQAMKKATKR